MKDLVQKLIDGKENIRNYDVNTEFDNEEIEALLLEKVISPDDLEMERASDLIIDGVLSYRDYPFEKFSPHEQIRQLDRRVISEMGFRSLADLEAYDGNDYLDLLAVAPQFDDEAPWEFIRNDASSNAWFEFLTVRPECAGRADWEKICREGGLFEAFQMLARQPGLYEYCQYKEELWAATHYWGYLFENQPQLMDQFPIGELDEIDEIELLLRRYPAAAAKIRWQKEDPPVELVIANAEAPKRRIAKRLTKILLEALHFPSFEAGKYARRIERSAETPIGIYFTSYATRYVEDFCKQAAQKKLPLEIRMKKFDPADEQK